jgi:hypothetical protein
VTLLLLRFALFCVDMEGSRKRSAALDDFEVEEEAVAGWDPKVASGTDPFAAGAAVALLRSERKRIREKQRRSETKRGFDELTGLLVEIDPEVRAMVEERAPGGVGRPLGAHEDGALSRVDLIDRTVTVLRRIHQENEQSKALIDRMMRLRDLPVQLDLPGRDEVRRIQKHCCAGTDLNAGRHAAAHSFGLQVFSRSVAALSARSLMSARFSGLSSQEAALGPLLRPPPARSFGSFSPRPSVGPWLASAPAGQTPRLVSAYDIGPAPAMRVPLNAASQDLVDRLLRERERRRDNGAPQAVSSASGRLAAGRGPSPPARGSLSRYVGA